MDNAGGKSVAYLIVSKLLDGKHADLDLDSMINLFQRVAAGLVYMFFCFFFQFHKLNY